MEELFEACDIILKYALNKSDKAFEYREGMLYFTQSGTLTGGAYHTAIEHLSDPNVQYLKKRPNGQIYALTPPGEAFIKTEGYAGKYERELQEQKNQKIEKESKAQTDDLIIRKLRIDLTNAQRMKRWYIPLSIAGILGGVSGFVTLGIKLVESNSVQHLEERLNTTDTLVHRISHQLEVVSDTSKRVSKSKFHELPNDSAKKARAIRDMIDEAEQIESSRFWGSTDMEACLEVLRVQINQLELMIQDVHKGSFRRDRF